MARRHAARLPKEGYEHVAEVVRLSVENIHDGFQELRYQEAEYRGQEYRVGKKLHSLGPGSDAHGLSFPSTACLVKAHKY